MTLAADIAALRGSVGLSALTHVACLRLTGRDRWEVLDRVASCDLFLRDLQLRQALLLDDDARPRADLLIASDDDGFVLLADGLGAGPLIEHVRAHAPTGAAYELVDLTEGHSLLGLDGPFAWEALAALEGPDVIGFPYLTCYHPRPGAMYFRAGKTGEFGYTLLVPHAEAPALRERLLEAGARLALREVAVEALRHASLESWFFDIHSAGLAGLSPIELQLQWRLATSDKDYVGRAALRDRVSSRRITALTGSAPLTTGAAVTYGERDIGRVLVAERSLTLDLPIAIALIDRELAHSGIDRFVAGGVPVRTVSPPFVNNLSLFVNPQQHAFATRAEIAFPGPLPRRFGASR